MGVAQESSICETIHKIYDNFSTQYRARKHIYPGIKRDMVTAPNPNEPFSEWGFYKVFSRQSEYIHFIKDLS